MKFGATTKFAIGLGIGAGLLVIPVYYQVGVIHRNPTGFCFLATVTGFLAWLIGELLESKGTEARLEPAGGGKAAAAFSITLLSGFKYWGLALIVSSVSLASFEALRHKPHKPALAKSAPVKVAANKAEVKPEARPEAKPEVRVERNAEVAVVFPPLQLKGLVRNGAKSSAIINGHAVFIGERIDEVVLLAVGDEQATVGLGGQTKVLTMRK